MMQKYMLASLNICLISRNDQFFFSKIVTVKVRNKQSSMKQWRLYIDDKLLVFIIRVKIKATEIKLKNITHCKISHYNKFHCVKSGISKCFEKN